MIELFTVYLGPLLWGMESGERTLTGQSWAEGAGGLGAGPASGGVSFLPV